MVITQSQLRDIVLEAYRAGHSDAMDEAYPDVGMNFKPTVSERVNAIVIRHGGKDDQSISK